MCKLMKQSWLPLLCLIALVSFAPPAQAGDVDFACAGTTGAIPCSGSVATDGTDYWTNDTQVFNTTGEYLSTTAFTLYFDTSNVGQSGSFVISLTGGNANGDTLVGTIISFTSTVSNSTPQTLISFDILFTSAPQVVQASWGTPNGLSPFATVIVSLNLSSGILEPQSVDILISPTPEPTTMILFGSGLLAGAGLLRRKRKK